MKKLTIASHEKHFYIVWVGGIDDSYKTLEEAEQAKQDWIDKGYDDVEIEEVHDTI